MVIFLIMRIVFRSLLPVDKAYDLLDIIRINCHRLHYTKFVFREDSCLA